MSRKSLADQLFEPYRDEDPGKETWLVIYDFHGINPTTKFYDNLHRIQEYAEDGTLIQYCAFMTRDKRAAKAMKELVQYYRGYVMVFKGEPVDL